MKKYLVLIFILLGACVGLVLSQVTHVNLIINIIVGMLAGAVVGYILKHK